MSTPALCHIGAFYRKLQPEMRLILDYLRFSLHGKDADVIQRAVSTSINWLDFFWWLNRHRVLGLVYEGLKKTAWHMLPEDVCSLFDRRYRQLVRRSLAQAAETVRIIDWLRNNNIPAITIKGAALALSHYGRLGLRHAGDIDLLVPFECIEKADQLFFQDKYSRIPAFRRFSPKQQRVLFRQGHHFHYYRPDLPFHVEIHWRSSCFLNEQTYGDLSPQKKMNSISGRDLPAIPLRDTIIYLCAHGARHAWTRLFWLYDLALILKQSKDINWDQLQEYALEQQVTLPLNQGFGLAHALFAAPVPENILESENHARLRFLLNHACRAIMRRDPRSLSIRDKIIRLLYSIALQQNFRDRLYVLWQYSLNDKSWNWLPLPDALFPLYYLIRPIHWIKRRFEQNGMSPDAGPKYTTPQQRASIKS